MRRIHSYQQLEHSDCGITCVRIVARYWGKRISTDYLRSLCDMSRLGVTIGDVVTAFKGLGMESVAVNVRADEVERMPLPAVLCWEQKHFVVLYKVKGDRYYVADPARGKMTFRADEFYRCWHGESDKGVAVLADPTDEFEAREFEKPKTNWRLLRLLGNMLTRHRKSFTTVIALSLLTLAGDIAMPLIFQHTVDEGIMGKDIGLVWMLILSQLLIFLGNYVGNSVVEIILTKLGLKTGIEMMDRYLRKLVRLPMIFFERKVNSDLIQKAEEQARIRSFLTSMPDTFFFTTLSMFVFSGLLIYLNAWIFLLMTVMTGLALGWTALFLRKRREIDFSYTAAIAENRNNLYELVHGMHEVKTNNAQHVKIENWMRVQRRVNTLSMRSAFLDMWVSGGTNLLDRLRDIAVTGICAVLVIKGQMTIGEMMTVSYVTGRLSGPFNTLLGSIESVQDTTMSYSRLEEILEAEEAASQGKRVEGVRHDIRFEGVDFKYPGSRSPLVLRDLDFVIPRGKVTALVGASGCGKTTLIKLILGMFAPHKGTIRVGSESLGEIDNESWLEGVGAVMQNSTLFSGTLLSNIALSDEKPDRERAREAARLACLDSFIEGLPMGYDTRVGVAGVEMSGGQKQRLMIARAIYKRPDLLILDEATSSLDAGNEALIVGNLDSFFKGRTVVIAAHRLSTVSRADNIIYMEEGRIKEQGTHSELVERRGGYWALVRNQLELGR